MTIALDVHRPFSFEQTIAFVRRFPPCQGDHVITDDAITSAVAVDGRAVAFTIRGRGDRITVDEPRLAARAAHFIGAADDLAPLYTAAEGDPPFHALVRELHGLHHVRFLTLGEIAAYSVMMQRTPIANATTYKRRFLARFGLRVEVGGHTLRAMPELAELARLDGEAIAEAIGNARRGPQLAAVVRGVAAIGEELLRDAPYAAARDALLDVPGIGPFSAAAILLRGLGRMDEVPPSIAEDEARALYGRAYDPGAIARRYGASIGYWSFYLKTGVARRPARSGSGRRAAVRANVRA